MPETRTIIQTVYQFAELDDTARDRVRDWLNDYDLIVDTVGMIVDPDCEQYPAYVLPTYHDVPLHGGGTRREINHYASWEYGQEQVSIGYVIDLPAFMRHRVIAGKYRALYNAAVNGEVTAQVSDGNNRYYGRHEQFDRLEIDSTYWDTPNESQLEILRDLLETDMNGRIAQLSAELRAEIEYHNSDEYLIEMCDANDYRFDDRGNPV